MRKKPLPPSLTVAIEDDFIYIIKCRNRYGQVVTIGVEPTHEKAEKMRTIWMEAHNNRYWLNAKGELETFIETKPVPKVEPRKIQMNVV